MSLEFKEIASIGGKGGLFKIVKPTRSGMIIETLDDQKKKMVVSASNRISILQEISIYTHTSEGSAPLIDIMKKIHQEFGDDPGVGTNSSPEELRSFMQFILPDYDEERVYVSDIKKLVSWYMILLREDPEIFTREPEKEEDASEKAAADKDSETGSTKEPEPKNTEPAPKEDSKKQ